MQQRLNDTSFYDNKHTLPVASRQVYSYILVFLILLTLAGFRLFMRGVRRHHRSQKTQMQRSPQEKLNAGPSTDPSPPQAREISLSSGDKSMDAALSQQQPPGSSIRATQNSGNSIWHALKHLIRIEDPIPVEAQGISLYALWDGRYPLARPPMEVSEGIGARATSVGLWRVIHLIWLSVPAVTATEGGDIVKVLCHRLDELYPTTPPTYLIFHIDKLSAPKPLFFPFLRKKTKIGIESAIVDVKAAFVEDIQLLCGLGPEHLVNGWLPNRFRHYDPDTQQRGWLVVSPTRALLVDVGGGQIRLLANLLQPYDSDRNRGPGIVSERYRELLALVMQWVSNQDSFQAVNQLKNLVESGTKAIDGQVLLNFAVAGIAILIAFLLAPGQTHSDQLIASVGCLAVASLWFWFYARSGRVVFQLIGWVFVLVIIPCFLAWSQLVSLFDTVVKFLSHL